MAKLKLTDVDGTIPGRAALVSINLDTMMDYDGKGSQFAGFVEGEHNCADPIESAWALWESIKDDFPGRRAAVIANSRAKYLAWKRRIEALGMKDTTPKDYLDLDR